MKLDLNILKAILLGVEGYFSIKNLGSKNSKYKQLLENSNFLKYNFSLSSKLK